MSDESILSTALTPEQVRQLYYKYAKKDIDIHIYDAIIEMDTVDSLFRLNNDACIIFYPFASMRGVTLGHYVALTRIGNNYYFYDPLAYKIDEYKDMSVNRLELYRERNNTLVRLLLEKLLLGGTVDYNTKMVQSRDSSIATCGRWSALRCRFSSLTNDEFNELVMRLARKFNVKGKTKDELFLFI
jgi:hypothetical protein